MASYRWLLVLLVTLALAALACRALLGSDSETSAEQDEHALSINGNEAVMEASDGTPTTSPVEKTDVPVAIDLSDPGLYVEIEDVPGYDIDLDFSFEGINADGSTNSGRIRATGGRTVDPPVLALTFVAEGASDFVSGNMISYFQTEEAKYVVLPNGSCIADVSGQITGGFAQLLSAENVLAGEAQLIETGVVVNGVLADRYQISSPNVNMADPSVGEITQIDGGSIAVTRGSGTIVQVIIDGRGIISLLSGSGVLEGDIYFELNFVPNRETGEIEIPGECQAGSEAEASYALLEDGKQITMIAGVLAFVTTSPHDEIAAFYRDEMAASGRMDA